MAKSKLSHSSKSCIVRLWLSLTLRILSSMFAIFMCDVMSSPKTELIIARSVAICCKAPISRILAPSMLGLIWTYTLLGVLVITRSMRSSASLASFSGANDERSVVNSGRGSSAEAVTNVNNKLTKRMAGANLLNVSANRSSLDSPSAIAPPNECWC